MEARLSQPHSGDANCKNCLGPCVLSHRPWRYDGAEATLNEAKSDSVGARKFTNPKADTNFLFQFPDALEAVARVLEFGAEGKEYPWQHFTTLSLDKQRASLTRHLLRTGSDHVGVDDESKMLHAVHLASRSLMYLQSILTKE